MEAFLRRIAEPDVDPLIDTNKIRTNSKRVFIFDARRPQTQEEWIMLAPNRQLPREHIHAVHEYEK